MLLRPLTARPLSRAAGWLLNQRVSCALIGHFIRKSGVRMADYLPETYHSFNDFFTRHIRPELRPLPQDPACLSAPCDGRLSAYHLEETGVFDIKGSRYDVRALLGGDPRAALFAGGDCLVFRLCVDDYHRYHYIDDGEKGENVFIPGRLHTVRPIALEHTNVFIQNCREYTLMQTRHFGTVAQIEVGALLVGRICNLHGAGPIQRGAEKGRFEFGGSTVIVLFQKDAVRPDPALLARTAADQETPVQCGAVIGHTNP